MSKAQELKRKRISLKLSLVGQRCVYCGKEAEVWDHVIPKFISSFFDAGWNLVPACATCNHRKLNQIVPKFIKTPGESPYEDAAVWAVVYKLLDTNWEEKRKLIELAKKDLGKYGFLASEAFSAFEVYVGEHICSFWIECEDGCSTGGQLVALLGKGEVHIDVPKGLEGLISGSAYR